MGLNINLQDGVGTQIQAVDPTMLAARVSIRPLEFGNPIQGQLLGHYRAALVSGATNSLAAAAVLASLRWTSTNFLVLVRISASAGIQTALTAVADMNEINCFIFRGSTGNAAAGTAVSLNGVNQKNRQSMGTSLVADLRVATAAAVTAATGKTNDGVPFASGCLAFPTITIGSCAPKIDLYKWDALGQYPVILSSNEGIEIQNVNTGPTVGAVRYFFDLEWAEVATF